ncbi:MAG: choice-of-anchor tandem repeat GloVer-containing protein [Candidatus Korobacteraceae bacterium]|jgi:uncharacterized repeat protein (TIGR03803 family)
MGRVEQRRSSQIVRLAGIAGLLALLATASPAQAQTFTVLHEFTGGSDGSNPYSSLAMDRSGSLYGVAPYGGYQTCETQNGIGCGTAFKLLHRGNGWVFATLYEFTSGSGGSIPIGTPTIASDGTVYGTTDGGGNLNCRDSFGDGCGTVFHLRPQPTFCASLSCPWINTVLYTFTGTSDGNDPYTGVVLDGASNVYGTTYAGGSSQLGVAYELSHSGSGWTESTIHTFAGGDDGANPSSAPIFDSSGNLYGTTAFGGGCSGKGCGTIFQLTPSGSGWNENILYNFSGSFTVPIGGLIFDAQGNLYGTASDPNSVFEMSPSNGGWSTTLLYSDESLQLQSFRSALVRDAAGNLYGTSELGGLTQCNYGYGCGFVYKLTPSSGGWTFTQLYAFTDGSDGAYPVGGVVLDDSGNIYGTTYGGGTHQCGSVGCGTVWEITP